MAVTYRRRKQAMPYKTRLTGRLMFLKKWGVRRNTPDPSPFPEKSFRDARSADPESQDSPMCNCNI
jgi:hypothetical protein